MKHKTFFRLMLKLLGVWIFALGFSRLCGNVSQLIFYSLKQAPAVSNIFSVSFFEALTPAAIDRAIGAYLFFGGKWIADKAIPSNRPYCHECGYELTNNSSERCPECGTATPPAAA
jgi:hypothetical protein